jgi:hypothetical protein
LAIVAIRNTIPKRYQCVFLLFLVVNIHFGF